MEVAQSAFFVWPVGPRPGKQGAAHAAFTSLELGRRTLAERGEPDVAHFVAAQCQRAEAVA